MANVQNEICDSTHLRDLVMAAAQTFSMIYSARQWTGGEPPEFPDIYLPLRLYNGSGCHYDLDTYWDDTFDWNTVALMSYVGIPELYRQFHSHAITDYVALFPVFAGLPTLESQWYSDGSPQVIVDGEACTDAVWYRKEWVTGESLVAARGICPPPSAVWHGAWPSGYWYNTIPELVNGLGVTTWLAGHLLSLRSQWDLEHVQQWQVYRARTRGYTFAGYGENSNVEDWEGSHASIDMTAFMANNTSGFVPLDISFSASTANGTPYTGNGDCTAQVLISLNLRGFGAARPGMSGEPAAEYMTQLGRQLDSTSTEADLSLGLTHADLLRPPLASWPYWDSDGRPLLAPFSAVRIQTSVQGFSSVLARTTAPSGSARSWMQGQAVGGSHAYMRVGPYEYEVSA